jgi:hypothetical protein
MKKSPKKYPAAPRTFGKRISRNQFPLGPFLRPGEVLRANPKAFSLARERALYTEIEAYIAAGYKLIIAPANTVSSIFVCCENDATCERPCRSHPHGWRQEWKRAAGGGYITQNRRRRGWFWWWQ